MLILISDAFAPNLAGKLEQFGEVTDDKDRVKDAEIVLVRSKTKCTREYIDSAPNLKMIIRGGVGLDNVDREYAKEKGIIVDNTPAASSVAVTTSGAAPRWRMWSTTNPSMSVAVTRLPGQAAAPCFKYVPQT